MIYLDLLSVLAAAAAMVYAWDFVRRYRKEPWRDYQAGRHLMRFTTGLAIIITWSVAGLLARWVWPGEEALRVVLAVARCLIFGWCALMLRKHLHLLKYNIKERNQP